MRFYCWFFKNANIWIWNKKIVMYTDGGSRNNPGPAAIGVYLETLHKQYGHYIGERTNNEAEYEAVIFGLKKSNSWLAKTKLKIIPLYAIWTVNL